MNPREINAVASRFLKSIDGMFTRVSQFKTMLTSSALGSATRRASAPFPSTDGVTPTVSLKRHSDAAFSETPIATLTADEELTPSGPRKKARHEELERKALPKHPLATNTDVVNYSTTALEPYQSPQTVADIDEELREVLAEFSRFEPSYERLLRKDNKKKVDGTRIATYKAILDPLYRKRETLKAQIAMFRQPGRASETGIARECLPCVS